jgi:hypothetical protein
MEAIVVPIIGQAVDYPSAIDPATGMLRKTRGALR